MSETFTDHIEHAKQIYQARPDAFTAAAYQVVLHLDRLKGELTEKLAEGDRYARMAKRASKEADARLAKLTWQPIETAPQDGRNVLIFNEDGIEIGWWSRATSEWCRHDMYLSTSQPTHWMELPEPLEQPDE